MSHSRPNPTRWLALIVLCAGQLMVILDGSIVAVALPVIQRDLGFSQSALAWAVNAYLIGFGGLLLLAGRLGDLLGRRHIFVAGLLVFTAASVVCGVAPTQAWLIVARFSQGVGGAMAAAVVLGMIVALFPEPREFAKAMGVASFVGAAGASIGGIAGGVLTQAFSWHWIFLVNVPIGVVAIAGAVRLLEADRGIGLGKGADVAGAILVTLGLMLAVYTIVEVADYGWTSLHTLGFGALALLLLVGFVAREATAAEPLLPLRIFRLRGVVGANLIQGLMVAGLFGFQFMSMLYLQRVLGLDAMTTSLAFIPLPLVIAAVSLGLSARLNTRFSPRTVLGPGLALIAIGLALFARAPAEINYVVDVLPELILLGVGGGLSLPALMALSMAGVPPTDTGLASGLATTTTQIGGALGLAVLATLAAAHTEQLLANGASGVAALLSGYHLVFGIGAGLMLVGVLVALTVLRPSRPSVPNASAPAREMPVTKAA